jgi:hypothetical protein
MHFASVSGHQRTCGTFDVSQPTAWKRLEDVFAHKKTRYGYTILDSPCVPLVVTQKSRLPFGLFAD